MRLVTRAGWKARAPKNTYTVTWATRTEFFVHHTDGPQDQSIKSIQDFHMGPSRGWSDIGYNFLVHADGTIYEGRGWLTVGAHCPDHNRTGIGVAFIGDNNPTAAAKKSIRYLYDEACRRAGRKLRQLGHGDRFPTACPGPRLQAWVDAGMPAEAEEAPKVVVKDGVPQWPGRVLKVSEPMQRGDDVKTWQGKLAKRGWTIDVDGWYGPKSRTVCRGYQRATGLPVTGEVDAATWEMTWSWTKAPSE
ncbi:peptidoglycan-binding domain-containing protein [Nonomuraea bangladeshensis]|uniref:Peptidoglycan-binding domain-containing protein n=1 Tax=Nonomuraea bangladeshensis TaxID=404385 RepID=A0ABV3H496_9ACTN